MSVLATRNQPGQPLMLLSFFTPRAAANLSARRASFQYSDLPMEFYRDLAAAGTVAATRPGTFETDALIPRVLHTDAGLAYVRDEVEKQCICEALREAQGNQHRAAEILRISPTWLRKRLNHFGLRAT